MQSLPTYRQQRVRLAGALADKARRQRQALATDGRPVLDLLSWAVLRRPLLKPNTPFDLARHAYLIGMYAVKAQVVVCYKASQMGASELAVSYALHAADMRKATVLYVFPTDVHVSDFSSARIGPAIEASPYLSEIVIDGGAGLNADGHKQRGADRVTLKRVRSNFLYLRGAQVKPNGQAPGLKSVDADVLILDEVDEMDSRAPAIAEKRLGHSILAEQRWISTPTYPGMGIHVKWLESDQREWHVRCEKCGEWQPLSIQQVILEQDKLGRPVRWNGDNDPFVACRKCSAPLNRMADGEWVATHPGRDVVGFHLTKLFSPRAKLLDIIRALNTTDETKRREAYNQDLGETYTPRGGQMTAELLDSLRRDYAHGPMMGERCVLGADVGRVLHVVIRGPQHPETGERPQRWAGEVESFEALGQLMRQYNVRRAVVDAMPETTKAREFQQRFAPGVVWLAYYVNQKTGTKAEEPAQWDEEKRVVNLDRTRTLDQTYARFYDMVNSLPGHAQAVRDYYAHMKAPVRILEDGPHGQKVAVYVESGPDHLAHAENYCMTASLTPEITKRTETGQAQAISVEGMFG